MKIFVDTANIEEIKDVAHLVDGVTTNPSLIAKEGRDFKTVVEEICNIVDGPISAEVTADDAEGMITEGKELSTIHKNITIKVPMTNEGIKAVKEFSKLGIKTNVTLVFSANQALLAAKAGATFVSPFVGRLDDAGQTGMELIGEIRQIFNNYEYETQILTASVRSTIHAKEAALIGSDVATIPYKILKQMLNHPLTDNGIAHFKKDWESYQNK